MQRYQHVQVSDITGNWGVFDDEQTLNIISLVYHQRTPENIWTLKHNMHTNAFIINVFRDNADGVKELIESVEDIIIVDLDTVEIIFNAPVIGSVDIVFFDPIGGPVPSPTPQPSATRTPQPTVSLTRTITPTPTPPITPAPTPTQLPIDIITLSGIYSFSSETESMIYNIVENNIIDYNVPLEKEYTTAFVGDIKFDSNNKTLIGFVQIGAG